MIEIIDNNFCSSDYDKLDIYYEYYPRSLLKHMHHKEKNNVI